MDSAPIARLSMVVPSLDSLPEKSAIELFELPDKKSRSISSSLSSLSTIEAQEDKPNIPDGGWGWVVVFATFLLCMIADGVTFSFGLLYSQFLKEFEASNSATSWIGALFMSVPLLTGPLMSALVDKFGCRWMTIVGGVISASGFILSSKCNSINLMYLTFGALAGLGLGLIYVTSVVGVAFWFDKRRTLAVGIGSSGIGIGTFVFSPFTTYLLEQFGWRGTTLILGGCFLNMCVCGALMRDPDWIEEQSRENSRMGKSRTASKTSISCLMENDSEPINVEELRSFLMKDRDYEDLVQNLENTLESNEDKDKMRVCFNSAINIPTFVREHEKVPNEVLELLSNNKSFHNVIMNHYPSLILKKSMSDENHISKKNGRHVFGLTSSNKDISKARPHERPLLSRKYSTHERYFRNIKVDKNYFIHRGGLFNNKYKFKASSCPNIYRVSMVSLPREEKEEKWYSGFVSFVRALFDFSMFLELHFFLLSLSTIAFFCWFIVPYFYLAELMLQSGYTAEQASFTISNIGISNTIGLVGLGWAGDRSWMNITLAYAIFLVVCGLAIAGQMFFVHNYIMLQMCSFLFGLSMSSHFAFTPGIVMELVPLDRFTIAYGLQLLCQGIGTLGGPPFAGFVFDVTQTWEQTFYQAAIWMVLSGTLVALIPYSKNRIIIGRGSLEKDGETSPNKLLPLSVLAILAMVSMVMISYMTGSVFLKYFST